ncbi:hypothetical protein P8881_19165 [Bacillus haynesii]|uniref:hypothetical protein n=1 Tax=Bacillus haynesii TaxID=1925021 RepID=UPI0022810DE6|nr:hypothetical protein [Bacillus haynesii]MCY8009693.1 hypothetical protein [Bacillus haynesii]MCY8567392.1 hypothetical protein [Bacillus haynesii]MEC0709646.1 hypothetical protein [Bacillus haynesii]MEC0738801.1 hypothetical protein [Bacillus haynesii]
MIQRKDVPASWYFEGMEVTETDAGIEISACVLKHRNDIYPFEEVSFDLIPDDKAKVAYDLYVVLDQETNKMDYMLVRSYIEPDGYYPGYRGDKRLIHSLITIELDTEGNRNGAIYNYHKWEANNET